jgi:Lrp/AsnC family leucine-responsive transcriptional regulator
MINETEIILDKTDLHILRLMQENARISNADLARELGMAPSGILERVKKLEQKNVIRQYTARINPEAAAKNARLYFYESCRWARLQRYSQTTGYHPRSTGSAPCCG